MGFPIEFFQDDHFGRPINEFLDGLDDKQKAKAFRVFQWVQEHERVSSEHLKKLPGTDDIWEVRVGFAGNIQRYLGKLHNGRLVLVHAFVKKTQKTPAKEIALAEHRARHYVRTHGRA